MKFRKMYNQAIVDKLQELVNKYPDWRFGQILYNCDVITHSEYPVGETNSGELHYLIDDPFHEESKITWNRMIRNKFCFPKTN